MGEGDVRPDHELLHRPGYQHFAGAGFGADPRGDMHGEPAQVIADDLDLTGVDSGADLEVELLSGPQGDASTAPDPASVGSLRLRPSSRMLPDGSSEILPEQTAQRTRCPVFHIVARRTPLRWDAIHGLVLSHELPLITSENRPADVAPGNWCKYILARRLETGRDVADAVIRALTGDRDEPGCTCTSSPARRRLGGSPR